MFLYTYLKRETNFEQIYSNFHRQSEGLKDDKEVVKCQLWMPKELRWSAELKILLLDHMQNCRFVLTGGLGVHGSCPIQN